MLALLVLAGGCAKYNTFFNAKKAFDAAELVRQDAVRKHQDPPRPAGVQKADYETAIAKAQKLLDEYPGHSLSDDALFLQGKAYHRLESYRMSIRKFDLLFANFPASPFQEEALYLQALNYLLIGSLERSQIYLDNLAAQFPDSHYRAETQRVSGDNFFAMEDYANAAASYTRYLEPKQGIQDADRVGLKLASCQWELQRYAEARTTLDQVLAATVSAETAFEARLLQARVLVRLKEHGEAARLVEGLRVEAPIYNRQGMVVLVEAENLVAQGEGEAAAPLLENMPKEWQTPAVKAMAADLLGYEFLSRGRWDDAKAQFQEALRRKDDLQDAERTRRLQESLGDYLAADAALKDASGARAADLRLLQANALLLNLARPRMAVQLYLQAAADTAADSLVAARALYGASVAYRDYLADEDSAAVWAEALQAGYPDSPQAFEARRSPGDRTLLGYLLDMRSQEQRRRLEGMSEQERLALHIIEPQAPAGGPARPGSLPGVRRRMVYLARRPHILFPPPAVRQAPAAAGTSPGAAAGRGAAADSLAAKGLLPAGAPAGAPADTSQGIGAGAAGPVPPGAPGQGPPQAAPQEPQPPEQEKKDQEKEKEKKKLDENWDFLRSPRPAADPRP